MNHDKRRNMPPEERRGYQDRLNKREARAQEESFGYKSVTEAFCEEPQVSVREQIMKLAEQFASGAMTTGDSFNVIKGSSKSYIYMDEWIEGYGSAKPYLNTDWPGYKPEPEGLKSKAKKRWHAVQFKAHRAWVKRERQRVIDAQQLAELEEFAEEVVVQEGRSDLGWGGF